MEIEPLSSNGSETIALSQPSLETTEPFLFQKTCSLRPRRPATAFGLATCLPSTNAFCAPMQLIPFEPDDTEADEGAEITLTGIEVSGGDREQILQALRLNRQILHTHQPDAHVDEAAVRATIDDLLDQLNEEKDSS